MSLAQLQTAELKDLIAHFNWATDRRPKDVVSLSSTRRYLLHSMRPVDGRYQADVAGELVQRIKSKRVPGEYSRLLSLELLTALNPDSTIATNLATNLAGRMRTFSEAHHALDYCSGYWHHEPRLTGILVERLRALANTEAEQAVVDMIEAAL